jgi:hypothetical protein
MAPLAAPCSTFIAVVFTCLVTLEVGLFFRLFAVGRFDVLFLAVEGRAFARFARIIRSSSID